MFKRLLSRLHALIFRIDRWFKQRFTTTGMLFVGLLVLAGVFGVNTRANLAYQLALLAIAFLAVAWIASIRFRPDVTVRRRLPRHASDGDPVHYVVEVENHSDKPLRGLMIQEYVRPSAPMSAEESTRPVGYSNWIAALRRRIGAEPRPVPVPDVPAGGRVDVTVEWRPLRRGYVRLAGCTLLRPEPLGLMNARRRIALADSLLVIPKRYPVDWSAWTGELRDKPGGLSQAASTSGVEEFASLREYRPGDPLRHIDWKGWARLGVPIVKEYFETCFVRQALILDTWLPRGAPDARFEAAVSVAASFVAAGPAALRGALDLIFVGASVHRVPAGTGTGALDNVLEALACVEAQPHENFSMLMDCVESRAGELSACVCVLLDWDAARRELVETLRRMDVPLLVLLVDDEADAHRALKAGPMSDQPDRLKVVSPADLGASLARLAL